MIHFTKDGFERIQKELEELQRRRPKVVDELKRARELGDLSENGAYKAARFELSTVDGKIRRLEKMIQTAVVVNPPNNGKINVGSVVELNKNGQTVKYFIVGEYEADPIKGKISIISPLGRELVNKKAGDMVTISTPTGTVAYTVFLVR